MQHLEPLINSLKVRVFDAEEQAKQQSGVLMEVCQRLGFETDGQQINVEQLFDHIDKLKSVEKDK